MYAGRYTPPKTPGNARLSTITYQEHLVRTAIVCFMFALLVTPSSAGEAGPKVAQAEKLKALQARHKPLRDAITDLTETFGSRYPKGREFLGRLAEIERAQAAGRQMNDHIKALRREALIANPLVSGQPILFVVRQQYKSHYHAIDTLFHTNEFNPQRGTMHAKLFGGGGAMKVIDLANEEGRHVKHSLDVEHGQPEKVDRGTPSPPAEQLKVTTLLDVPKGIARDPDVHFDGGKIVFAMRRHVDEDYHICEINVDGTGLKQLTSAKGVCDFDPIYLPDGGIVFSSTREPKYNMCSRDIAANLFRMDADGANIHQITKNTLFDNHSSLLPDGRILYARWEYVDRNFGDAHGLWTISPDGTNQAVCWGNNTAVPGAVFNAQSIPGTQQVLCILGIHHDRLWGALGIIDRRLGIDGRPAVLRTWPGHIAGTVRAGGRFDCDANSRVRPKYEDPWPLSDKYFLCSRMTGKGEQMGIYLIDLFGNEMLLHTEGPGCYDPMPIAPRPRPRVIAPRRNFANKDGYLFVADVYKGTQMKGVKRGSVKSLRVVESPEKRHWSRGSWNGQGYTAPGMNWHSLENKRILGTVPVEEDGSAYFAVPAEKFIFFQLLDENGMMVQSMRSGMVVQPGETTGCVGCHEGRLTAPLAGARMPKALLRPPSKMNGWRGPPRLFGFMAEVQPVFNKHCLECHDYGKKGTKKLCLAPDRGPAFNTAYNELWRKRYIKCIGAGPAEVQPAYSWGSHASKIVHVIRKGHNDVKLSDEEFDRIVTWLDLNGVYYSTYACAYPESRTGRCPLDGKQLGRLGQLTGVSFGSLMSYGRKLGPLVSVYRPELSPCLAKFKDKNDPAYKEALAIIRAGKEMLKKRPRADMPGFVPCETDRKREQKYAMRRQAEIRSRQAIRKNLKVYDQKLD